MKSNIIFIAAILFIPFLALADDDDHEGTKHLTVVANDIYQKSCGSCHFAYQPDLLPSKTWVKIIDEPNAHPGGTLSLDAKTKAELKNYLTENSADDLPPTSRTNMK